MGLDDVDWRWVQDRLGRYAEVPIVRFGASDDLSARWLSYDASKGDGVPLHRSLDEIVADHLICQLIRWQTPSVKHVVPRQPQELYSEIPPLLNVKGAQHRDVVDGPFSRN